MAFLRRTVFIFWVHVSSTQLTASLAMLTPPVKIAYVCTTTTEVPEIVAALTRNIGTSFSACKIATELFSHALQFCSGMHNREGSIDTFKHSIVGGGGGAGWSHVAFDARSGNLVNCTTKEGTSARSGQERPGAQPEAILQPTPSPTGRDPG
ncbi:hypothetical protein ON010_g18339 [Phytophthora cinnamomi]|nr:hypothetical protein ON010_g18339 [Phytophthora cinnamomi]